MSGIQCCIHLSLQPDFLDYLDSSATDSSIADSFANDSSAKDSSNPQLAGGGSHPLSTTTMNSSRSHLDVGREKLLFPERFDATVMCQLNKTKSFMFVSLKCP